jgi:recombination protein RecT
MSEKDSKQLIKSLSGFLDKLKPQLELALPRHMNADRMARLALTAFSTNPNLQRCSPMSIAASIMTAGQLGLEPGINGAGFLIPYKETCTFVPGWKGLVDLVARSGRGTVYTGVIFSDQKYTFIDGAKRDLIIHNETELDDPADITHAFAIGWVRDATMPIIELWSVEKIRKHRDKYNKVGKNHYSYRDWEMYCRKVPLLQVLKYMPASVELANALEVANASEIGHSTTIENGIVIDLMAEADEKQPENQGKKDLATCTDKEFAELAKEWEPLVRSGKKKASAIISTAKTSMILTHDQECQIDAWEKEGQ